MDLQELISRARFIFAGASERLRVYELVDGRRTAKDLAKVTKRHINNIHRDLRRLADIGLIEERTNDGESVEKDGLPFMRKRTRPDGADLVFHGAGETLRSQTGHYFGISER